MDALVGFLADADEIRLKRMADTLVHRGSFMSGRSDHSSDFDQQSWASIGRIALSDDDVVGIKMGRRLLVDEGVTLLLCGYVTRWERNVQGTGSLLKMMLQSYLANGISALGQMQGSYLVAIADHRQKALHLVRDGAGMRTVFYGAWGEGWGFASEPKAVTRDPGFCRQLRVPGIAQYLSFSFVPGTATMLENLYELPCGHAVTLQVGRAPVLTNLFPFENEEPAELDSVGPQTSDQHWIDRTRQCVARAVADRLPRGEPVGVFLSGGLDSSVVAAEVAKQHDHKVLTYAIHFGDRYPNELEFARAVADRCGTEHHEVLIRPRDFNSRFREMVWHLDEPIGDPITQPNFELARRASQDVRWIFNGEGGDPVLGGPKNLPMMMQHWYGVKRDPNFRQQAYLASYRRAYDQCSDLLNEKVRAQIDWQRDLESVLTPFFDASPLRSFLNKLMAINIRLKGAHLILPKVERMLAAHHLTPLSPLFDEDLIRLSFQMPPKMKLRNGIEKWVLKRAYEDLLPKEVIDRPKSGMRVPVHYWFRDELRWRARRVLTSRRARSAELFSSDRVNQLLQYDLDDGPGRYGMRLWMLMTFEIWRQIILEGDSV